LKITEDIYRQIFELSEEGIWIADPDGKTILVNKKMADMLGYRPEEIIGRIGLEFLTEGQESIVFETRKELNANIRRQKEFQFRRSDGTTLWTLINTAPFFDASGQHIGNIALHTDITERKKTEEQLINYKANLEKLVDERTQQLKNAEKLATIGAVAGMVGHDIRNPLQSIAGDLYLIDQDVASLPNSETKKGLQESVNGIQVNLFYIAKIVEDLQDFAKTQKPKLEKIEISTVIEAVLQLISISPKHYVVIDIQPGFPVIVSDVSMLKRVFSNLVNNAIQAMPAEGTLTISAYYDSNRVAFCVSDTGVGIPEDVKDKLFAPMITTKSKGQGFGLAVVKRLVEALNGTITFETQEGQGTKFTFTLPKYA